MSNIYNFVKVVLTVEFKYNQREKVSVYIFNLKYLLLNVKNLIIRKDLLCQYRNIFRVLKNKMKILNIEGIIMDFQNGSIDMKVAQLQ